MAMILRLVMFGGTLVLRRLQILFGGLNAGSKPTPSLCLYLKAHFPSDARVTSDLFSVPRPLYLLVFEKPNPTSLK